MWFYESVVRDVAGSEFIGGNVKKILVVDDDAAERRLLTTALVDMGYTTIEASNGQLALSILNDNEDIQALITDMVMPVLDGHALVRILRGQSRWKKLPVIIVSAIVSVHDVKTLIDLGASRFLAKPVKLEHLEEYLGQLI